MQTGYLLLRSRHARQTLATLRMNSATGTDELGTRILQSCANELALPFCKLCRIIVNTGRWPDLWISHRICPLHKQQTRYSAANYRGIQITPQLSKAAERFIGRLFLPYLNTVTAFGPNQFAYSPGRGAKDALLFLVLCWLLAFAHSKKIGLYCSDVSGAFDKVDASILLTKARTLGLNQKILDVLYGWLC